MGPCPRPAACGALGRFDRERVVRLSEALGTSPRPVHKDRASILMLDREPLRWQGRRQRGLGWIEGSIWDGDGAASWEDASRRGACGLVLDGRERFLHSSVNGLGSIYWMRERGAVYFASEIDPLVQIAPGRLSVDWDAWASIVSLRFPAGERTPFAEIRRLEPHSLLRRRWGRFGAMSPAWPWGEAEPQLDRGDAAAAIVEALREQVSRIDGPLAVPLSGGRDSRMLACLAVAEGKAAEALTVSDDEGGEFEEEKAARVAASLTIPHECLRAAPEAYPQNWEQRARLVEHQFVDHAWLMPLSHRLDGAGLAIVDGFGIDALLLRGSRFYRKEALRLPRPRDTSLAMFDGLRHYGKAHLVLDERLRESVVARARDLFVAAAAPYEGNPSHPTLAFYRTRTVRGVAASMSGLLGSRTAVLAPGGGEAVAIAALSATEEAREDDGLYPAVFDLLNPTVGRLPSTSDTAREPPRGVRCWRADPALEMHRELLGDGPLAAYVAAELRDWLDAPEGRELSIDLRLGMEGVSLLHSWWRRYRHRLHEVDPLDLLG